jgi:predicted naringenin-chalcone synthase
VDAIEKTFALKQGQLSSTRTIMETLGNMSSPTVLFVLDHLRRTSTIKGQKVISLAFGPGLATEGVVLSLL